MIEWYYLHAFRYELLAVNNSKKCSYNVAGTMDTMDTMDTTNAMDRRSTIYR